MIIIFILKIKNDSECFENYLYNWDKTTIYDIYLSDVMTKDTIKLGELEGYSNLNIKVPHYNYQIIRKNINLNILVEIFIIIKAIYKLYITFILFFIFFDSK